MKYRSPKQQGELDGACGFYSIINALSLVLKQDMIAEDLKTVVSLHRKADETAVPWDVFDGMSRYDMNWVLTDAANLYSDDNGLFIWRPYWSKHPTLDQFWKSVVNHLARPNAAVITAFHKDERSSVIRSHWTVLSAATARTFSLFDSSGGQRILRKQSRMETKTHSSNLGRPYAFEASSSFFLFQV